MSFDNANVDFFLEGFNNNKEKIRKVEGCRLLELYRDRNISSTFFTYGYWATKADLEAYRNCDLFKTVWVKTRMLFNDNPEVWSVDKLDSLEA